MHLFHSGQPRMFWWCFHYHFLNMAVDEDMGLCSKFLSNNQSPWTLSISAKHFQSAQLQLLWLYTTLYCLIVIPLLCFVFPSNVLYSLEAMLRHSMTSLYTYNARPIRGYHYIGKSEIEITLPDQSVHWWVCWLASACFGLSEE